MLIGGPHAVMLGAPARADGSGPQLASFACGQSGWLAIDRAQVLWHGGALSAPQRVADDVGTLWVKGQAHRGQ